MDTAWIATEFATAKLGDPRQVRSLVRIVTALARQTDQSLTAACGPALRQAAHRIFEHPETSIDGLLAGHFAATATRAGELSRILIAQDTTAFVYHQDQITGLAPVNQSSRSAALFGHAALALTEAGTPLGLLHLSVWGADPEPDPRPEDTPLPPEERESAKWQEALDAVVPRLLATTEAVFLQDREADYFGFLAAPRPAPVHLLLRAAQDRRVEYAVPPEPEAPPLPVAAAETVRAAVAGRSGRTASPALPLALAGAPALGRQRGRLFSVAAQAPVLGTMTVTVPRRPASRHQIAAPARPATLTVQARPLALLRPHGSSVAAREVAVWVVTAVERDPPAGETALHWVLLSTLPVTNEAEAIQAVTYYARRWLCERLHFTLKSGLRAERLQIDDADSLRHALAVYYAIAYRLLYLTYTAREDPDAPAHTVLNPDEIAVLEAQTGKPVRTAADAVREVAILGGYQYYRTAPPPGVKSLWHGWRRLVNMVAGWRLARNAPGALPTA